jgi:hypothetical protein
MRNAIVRAGTFRRLFLTSGVRHLLWPLVQQGYPVDSLVSLTTDAAKAYRSAYMNETTWDTAAFGSKLDKDGQTLLPAPNAERIHNVRDRLENQCGRLRHIAMKDVVDVAANARLSSADCA